MVVGETVPTEHFHRMKRADDGCAYNRQEEKSEQSAGTYSPLSETKPGAINAAAGRVL